MYDVHTRDEALDFLTGKGTKVALQVGHEGSYVFVEKGDFIRTVLRGSQAKAYEGFVNYDGTPEAAFVEGNILHVPCGVM